MKFPGKDDPGRPIDKLSPGMMCRWHGYITRQYLIANARGAIICSECDFPDTSGKGTFADVVPA